MARGARTRPTYANRIRDIQADDDLQHSLLRRTDTPVSETVAPEAGASGGSNVGPSPGNYLPVPGGTMIGPIAFFPKLVQISSGAIDIGEDTDDFSSRVIITSETGTTDDLVTITGAKWAGQLLFLQGTATHTITLKTTGNIETIEGSDFTLADDDILIFQFDTTDNKWQQITTGKQGLSGSGDNLGDHTATQNLDMDGNIIILDANNDTFIQSDGDDNWKLTVGSTLTMQANTSQITFYDNVSLNNNPLDNFSALNGFNTGTITSTASSLDFDVDSGDWYAYHIAGTEVLDIIADGELQWVTTGMLHQLIPSATAMTMDLGASTDDFIIRYNGDTDIQHEFSDNHYISKSDTSAYIFESIYDDATPADDTTMAVYQWNYPNDAGTLHVYAEMAVKAFDSATGGEDGAITWKVIGGGDEDYCQMTFRVDTVSSNEPVLELYEDDPTPGGGDIGFIEFHANNASNIKKKYAEFEIEADDNNALGHDGAMKFKVAVNGSMTTGMEINGERTGPDVRIGVFGTSPVAQQSVASDTLANLYTALRNYGWIA